MPSVCYVNNKPRLLYLTPLQRSGTRAVFLCGFARARVYEEEKRYYA